jgi:iron complex transport system permease protein
VLLVASAALSLSVGAGSLRLPQLAQAAMLPGSAMGRILYHVRIPRTLATILAGAGLAVAGVITQSVLENALASPGIIGVNAGAGFAAILCAALAPSAVHMLPLAAFLGAFLTVLLVYGAARRAGASRTTLVLAGVAVSSLLSAGSTLSPPFSPTRWWA